MLLAPIPENEVVRQQALNDLAILDSEAEESYESIVRLASHICGTPMASIAFMDRDRQWVKASTARLPRDLRRDTSFCGHALMEEDLFVVEDAGEDPRFRDNPLVIGAPFIRFYAGQRLVAPDGMPVGTLCVADSVPHVLTVAERDALRTLGRQVSSLLELRVRMRQLDNELRGRTAAECAARAAQREATAARDVAERANRAKSEFLARMSHELRTPLDAIIGFANVVRRNREGHLSDTDRSFVERISANGQHLRQLINDLLDVPKIEPGRAEAGLAPVSAADLVHETASALQVRRAGDGRASTVRVIGEVPSHVRPIESDRWRLKQILITLVGNALKFTEHGRVVVRVLADLTGGPTRIEVPRRADMILQSRTG